MVRRTYLAVVEVAGDGEVVNVGIEHSGHLKLLDGAYTALGVKHENGDILLAAQTVDGGGASVTARRANNSQVVPVPSLLALVLAHEEVLKEVAEELKGDILEGKGRAVEELEKMYAVLEVDKGSNLGSAEGSVGAVDDVFKVFGGDL